MSELIFLSSVEMCQGLNVAELAKLNACCRPDGAAQDERIGAEGQAAQDLFFLREGRVELRFEMPGRETSPDMTVARVEPGAAFGWSALVPPYRYTLSTYCVSPRCSFFRLGRDALFALFDREPRIGFIMMRNLTQVVAKRFHAMQEDLAQSMGLDLMDQRLRDNC
ncbi:MAG: cyclic nucleotide-binding domain-containing protein [Pseudomonadota bacterium]